ncbi:MAG: flagellar export chaperone FliS [Candidatus Magnetoovum sp. WYHC-5]|nr:flagellar export chaperone FliS [Candidatus Magnetoovum sp. WYHC-5]
MIDAYVHNAYMTTGISSLSPLELVIKLYDGAISFLNKVATAIKGKDKVSKIQYINKTRAIVEELLNSLKVEEGGEVAQNLQDLYTYMLIELARLHTSESLDKVYHIQDLLKTLRSAWQEIRQTMPSSELSSQRYYVKAN